MEWFHQWDSLGWLRDRRELGCPRAPPVACLAEEQAFPSFYPITAASFRRLWAVQIRLHSPETFSIPRIRNCRKP